MSNNSEINILARALKESPVAFLIVDKDGIIQNVNNSLCNIFMYSQSEIIGKNINILLPAELRKVHQSHISNFFQHPNFRKIGGNNFLEGQRKNGTKIQVEVGLSFFESDGRMFGVANIIEVAENIRRRNLLERTQSVAKIGSWHFDMVKNNLFWSKTTYDIHELDTSTPISVEEGINFYFEDDKPVIARLVEEGISNRKPWSIELRIVTAKGHLKWVCAIGTPIVENDVLIGLEGTFQDIHEKKMLEIERDKALNKLIKTEGCAKIGNWEWNTSTDEVVWSKSLFKIFELPDDSKAPTIEEHMQYIHPEDRHHFSETLSWAIKNGKSYSVLIRLIRNDKIKYVLGEGSPEFDKDGSLIGFFGIAQDITNSRKSDLERQHLIERLNLALEASEIGVWEWRIKSNELVWDNKMLELYGVDQSNFSGAYEAWQNGLHPDDKDRVEKEVQLAIEGQTTFNTSFRVVHPNNQKVHTIKAKAKIIEDENGNPQKMIGVNWDVTKSILNEKRIQDALEKSLDAAEKAEEAEKVALNEKIKAQEASASKSLFLANMSHEIRTPMNGLLGMIELATEIDNVPSEAQELLTHAKNAGKSLLHILNDILDLSKIESSKLEIEHNRMLLSDCLNEVTEFFKFEAKKKGLEFKQNFNSEDLIIFSDQTRLRQIFFNLLSNAIKFTHDGYVSFELSCKKTSPKSVQIDFIVKDTGIGINKAEISRMFDDFTQSDSSVTRKYGGTGLGLSICSKLIDLLGGKISVYTNEPHGTKFVVSLPFVVGEIGEQMRETSSRNKQQSHTPIQLQVLVAEDNEVNQIVLCKTLKKIGCTFKLAANGAEAVALVEKEHFDVVLMDIQMPVMDGILATKKIIEIKGPDSPPIVALTANVFKDDQEEYFKAGITSIIEKPLKRSDLIALFDNLKKS